MKIAIDMGGTKIQAGLLHDDGSIKETRCVPCNALGSRDEVLQTLFSLIEGLMDPSVTRIGIGVPSIVDAEKGIVYNVTSIPSWDKVPLKDMLEEKFGVPAKVNNDCNCFARGVLASEEFRGYKDMVCVTLGTGVGSGLIVNRSLYVGGNSCAGEIGDIPYLDKNYEFYCSSRFFKSLGTTGKDLEDGALAGDASSIATWAEFGGHVGELMKLILLCYDPEVIVLGGGISKAFPFYEKAMLASLEKFQYPQVSGKVRIVPVDTLTTMMRGAVE